jgi:hypothetical protein
MKRKRKAYYALFFNIVMVMLLPCYIIATEPIKGLSTVPFVVKDSGDSYVVSPAGSEQPMLIRDVNTAQITNVQSTHDVFPFHDSTFMYGGTDWSNSGGNPQRNGRSDVTGPSAADLLWSGARASLISWLPVTEGDRLFVVRQKGWPGSNNDSLVVAMNLSSGAELWNIDIPYHSGDWTTWIAGVKNGHVYASRSGNGASVKDNLYALDTTTGSLLWTSTERIDAGPYDGVVFAPDGDPVIASFTDIWRINADDGSTVWHANRLGSVSGSCGGTLYQDSFYVADVASGGHIIVRYDFANGERLYQSPVMPGFTLQNTPMAGPDGTIYLSRTQNNPTVDYFYAFTDTGTSLVEKWHLPCAWTTFSEFAVGPDGGVYCIIPGPRIGKLDAATGTVTAQSGLIDAPGYSYLAPHFAVDATGTVFFSNGGFENGRVSVYTPNLEPLWNVTVTNINIGGPALAEKGTLLVCGTGTTMRAYRSILPWFDISISARLTKIHASITNSGGRDATNLHWNITVTGGILKRIHATITGSIPVLAVGNQSIVSTDKLLLGFGKITISVRVSCDEGVSLTKNASGRVFLFLIVGVT